MFYDNPYEKLTQKSCVIGNDVWIGVDSIIRRGVTIGDGVVIGANSFVNSDIPDYAIAAGSPAKILKLRFTPERIAAVQTSKWWDYDLVEAKAVLRSLETGAEAPPSRADKAKENRNNKFLALMFSKDRAMRLDVVLRSLTSHCRDLDGANMHIQVLYTSSSYFHERQYRQMAEWFPHVTFVRQGDFKKDLLTCLKGHDHVFFMVDDNIFVKDFLTKDIVAALERNPRAIGFSLRLGRNTTYCYMLKKDQPLPAFRADEDLLLFDWTASESDFGYPLEVSSSVYRVADIEPLVNNVEFSNPNTLEALMDGNKSAFKASKPDLLCYGTSVAFCNPANMVQTVFTANRARRDDDYGSDKLANIFAKGYRINIERYSGFIPVSCHEEVDYLFERRDGPARDAHVLPLDTPLATIGILNQNGLEEIKACPESLAAHPTAAAPTLPLHIEGGLSAEETLDRILRSGLWKKGEPLRLHLGCGENHLDGYVNVDYPPSEHTVMTRLAADIFADIEKLDLPDWSVGEVRLHHVFEHFNRSSALALLIRWHRWLRIGGVLYIETPDLIGNAKVLLSDISLKQKMAVVRHLAGSHEALWANHVDHWFPERFEHTLEKLGFEKIVTRSVNWQQEPHANVHAAGLKARHMALTELLDAADAILWESTVAPSETAVYEVWRKDLRDKIRQNGGNGALDAQRGGPPPHMDLLKGAKVSFDSSEFGGRTGEVEVLPIDTPLVTIGILNHNGLEQIKVCLEAVARNTPEDHEIIVVDNGSTDGSVEFLRSLSRIVLIENPKNLGPTTRNRFLSLARGRHIVFLDNDTIVTKDWLTRLIELAASDRGVGIVGACANYASGLQLVQNTSYKNIQELEQFAAKRAAEYVNTLWPSPRLVTMCVLLKRELLERIGGLDESFGMFGFEDDDYAIRATISGFKSVVAPGVFIHHTGGPQGRGDKQYNAWLCESWEVFKKKWGLPGETEYGTYDIGAILRTHSFDSAKHYVPLPDRSSIEKLIHSRSPQKGGPEEGSRGSGLAKKTAGSSESSDGPLVSIIILNVNGRKDIEACLDSIARNTTESHEVIVLDNGSTDGSVDYLRGRTDILLIESPVNMGVAPGRAKAMAYACGRHMVLLDSDTLITSGWIAGFLAHIDSNKQIGMMGPRSNYVSGTQVVPKARYGTVAELRGVRQEVARETSRPGFARLTGHRFLYVYHEGSPEQDRLHRPLVRQVRFRGR